MKMISFCNNKGGVGKTTLCKNVAYKFALDGAKVLLIDLDPQATLSTQLATSEVDTKKSLIKIIGALDMVDLKKLIQTTNTSNVDIIIGNHELNKASALINSLFNEKDRNLIATDIYKLNEDTLNSYDYVLIDYPPTIQELAISFLLISDLIVSPVSSGNAGCKGLLDLRNLLNKLCREYNFNVPSLKVIINDVNENDNLDNIKNWLKNENFEKNVSDIIIKKSEIFPRTENSFISIWDNNVYWRQKQAYEELIKEIK
uniref:SOJ-like transmembrane protein n=2 Tax=Spiroplasma citri TaxID=2133 RepID=Q3ZVM8_SPICI|nr:SOJ-like transmembrane protein [Spiroplasma citri]